MKLSSLVLFAALIFFGWTALAASAIAALAGQPGMVSRPHDHPEPTPAVVSEPAPLVSDAPPGQPLETPDASVPCSA